MTKEQYASLGEKERLMYACAKRLGDRQEEIIELLKTIMTEAGA